ncbi:hypothetical protein [Pseudomonas viridiflava]|uniref:hypothetical protein n=1 Tax=Pseudomonas viridiflava TaxID=33069 RepID=UPI001F11EC09|nr:hypothetical protein [Pseudomonas viridiflava]
MINLFWRPLAKLLARLAIAAWLITRAQRTPYLHIRSADGQEVYMGRWWLFNAYDRKTHLAHICWITWSIRVNHIMRPDADRELHDHPWDARTVILRDWYTEQRLLEHGDPVLRGLNVPVSAQATEYIDRRPSDTAQLKHGEDRPHRPHRRRHERPAHQGSPRPWPIPQCCQEPDRHQQHADGKAHR